MTSKVGYIKDANLGIQTTISFTPLKEDDSNQLGGTFLNEKVNGVLNIPTLNGESVSVRKSGGEWEVPNIESYGRETIQESIDNEMKKKLNATGTTEIIGYISISIEVNGQNVGVTNTIITVFKVGEMGEFHETLGSEERSTQTLEDIQEAFAKAPGIEGDNPFLHVMEVALTKG